MAPRSRRSGNRLSNAHEREEQLWKGYPTPIQLSSRNQVRRFFTNVQHWVAQFLQARELEVMLAAGSKATDMAPEKASEEFQLEWRTGGIEYTWG